MRILHCCLACFYIDGYSYQENVLPRYHKYLGHEVEIVASTESFDKDGNFTYVDSNEYYNEDGIKVIRLPYAKRYPSFIVHKLRRYIGLEKVLTEYEPDFIFLHDIQFLDIDVICKYATKKRVKMVADCHADFSNSARNWVSRKILHGIIYKACARKIEPFVSQFYGVLPARVDFLVNVYGIPSNKVDLLVMGAEDDLIESAMNKRQIEKIKIQYGISSNSFVIVTGGKIDNAKKQILLLMNAINQMDEDVHLLIFGSVLPELKEEFCGYCSEKVHYVGWLDYKETYKYLAVADLVCFPGRHSVLWEQVVGMGIPLLVKYWEGTTHIDCDGNVEFLYRDSCEEIIEKINYIRQENVYLTMKKKATSEDTRGRFLYSKISMKCIEK